jgi:hypothetical protein
MFPRWLEAELSEPEAADRLFVDLAGRIKVRKFEILEPSLHSIFIRLAGNTLADGGNTDTSGPETGSPGTYGSIRTSGSDKEDLRA